MSDFEPGPFLVDVDPFNSVCEDLAEAQSELEAAWRIIDGLAAEVRHDHAHYGCGACHQKPEDRTEECFYSSALFWLDKMKAYKRPAPGQDAPDRANNPDPCYTCYGTGHIPGNSLFPDGNDCPDCNSSSTTPDDSV